MIYKPSKKRKQIYNYINNNYKLIEHNIGSFKNFDRFLNPDLSDDVYLSDVYCLYFNRPTSIIESNQYKLTLENIKKIFNIFEGTRIYIYNKLSIENCNKFSKQHNLNINFDKEYTLAELFEYKEKNEIITNETN